MKKILLIIALCISSFIYGQNTIQFPNDRLVYPSVGNPLFVTDYQNATQSVNESMRTLLGMPTSGATSFAILSGFTYTAGSPGTYSAGYVIYADTIYYCSTGTREGKYLKPHTTKIQSKLFQDGISRYTYQVYKIDSFYHSYLSFPVFSGDMNAYRISSSALRNMCNNSLKIDSLRTITKTIINATPVTETDSKATSVLANIIGNNAGTNTYDYHIGANTNMVYFNLNFSTGYILYFNIYNYANAIIKTLTVRNGYLNENFLMINDGTEWIELDGVNGFGTTAGTICQGNDARLSDARELKDIAGVTYQTKKISIGTWNMNTTPSVNIAHGIADFTKIISVYAFIYGDDGSFVKNLNGISLGGSLGGECSWEATNITLERATSGLFDGSTFATTPTINGIVTRGYIIIQYIP